ncbi:MAG: endonuclease/exonuclease/phosphatase family protein [Clostridia bacterium]|nr:endonuclease/exonuclease/phosphatase family protein [Clostridia bacterium]
MKKGLRLIALLLAMILALGICSACTAEPPTEPPAADVPPSPPEPATIVKDGVGQYQIVYSSTDPDGRKAALSLQTALQNRTTVKLEVVDDRTAPTEGTPEILVGRTNRGTDYSLQRALRVSEWIIARDGDNIYLLGEGEALLKRACEHFVNVVLSDNFQVEEYGEIHRVSGRYSVEGLTLNGLPLTDYKIYAEEQGAVDFSEILTWVDERVSAVSGYMLTVADYTEGAAVNGPALILTADRTLGDANYKIEVDGSCITVTVGSVATALVLFADLIENQLPTSARGNVALTVSAKQGNVGDRATVALSDGADLRVMTYNVLGNVEKATDYISATVAAYLPDFLCTQEYYGAADSAVTTYLSKAGYGKICGKFTCASPTAVEKEDEQYTKVGKYCNTPIFYRTDRWEVVESEAYLFYWQSRWPYTDTKSMAYGVFRSKDDGRMVLVVGTHYALMGSGYKEYADLGYTDAVEGANWRYQNSLEILKAVDAMRQKYPRILTVVGGDLNANVSERAIKTLEDHDILSNAYEMAPSGNRTAGGTYHSTHGKAPSGKAIDHIFVSEDVADVTLHRILKEQYVLEGSDHCPVIADISIK